MVFLFKKWSFERKSNFLITLGVGLFMLFLTLDQADMGQISKEDMIVLKGKLVNVRKDKHYQTTKTPEDIVTIIYYYLDVVDTQQDSIPPYIKDRIIPYIVGSHDLIKKLQIGNQFRIGVFSKTDQDRLHELMMVQDLSQNKTLFSFEQGKARIQGSYIACLRVTLVCVFVLFLQILLYDAASRAQQSTKK